MAEAGLRVSDHDDLRIAQLLVDMRRRRALRLVLEALVVERMRAPGVPVSMQRLIEVGWPGEKMRTRAGLSRLYVTVRALRELGLRSALLRQDDGYLLDPTALLVAAPAHQSSLEPPPPELPPPPP